MKLLMPAILALTIVPLGACRGNDLGSGTNTVDREYPKPAAEVSKAALKSAESADFKVRSDKHDQMGGELLLSRADGKEVRILVKSIDEKSARVSVRVEPGDRDLAVMVQERIAVNLGMGAATTGWWSGGSSLVETYEADLTSCMVSARRTLDVLGLGAKDEEVHATWCRVDARQKDSTPVRIRLDKVEDRKTRVTFIAGSARNEDNKAFARKMKEEFESTTRPAGGSR